MYLNPLCSRHWPEIHIINEKKNDPKNYLVSCAIVLESVHYNLNSLENDITYWCSGFASGKFEKILGAGHVRVSQKKPKVENSKSYPPEILDMVKWFPKSQKI